MSHYTENQYRVMLDNAEKKLDMLERLPNQQWTLVNNTTSKDKIYRTYTTSDDHPTWKVDKQLNTNQTNLDYLKTCLLTIDLRSQWYPWFTEYKVLDKPNSHVHIIQAKTADDHSIDWAEKVIERKRQVRYFACSMHSAINYYLAIHIETSNSGGTRAVVYYQWDQSTATHTSDILSSLLDNLCNLCLFSWISQSDKAIDIKHISYTQDTCEIDYTCQQKETTLPAPAVDIHKINQQHRWHSGSWDQQSSLSQTLRKNNFLSSSSLVFNSASSSPQLHPTTRSSYPENQHMFPWLIEDEREEQNFIYKQFDSDELRIQVTDMPQLSISLVDKQEWSDKFAQLCVRCFYRQPLSNKANYVIQILHPHKWMQYFKEYEQETMRLDDEDEITPIHVKLILQKSKDNRCIVNNNEWPIRSWSLSSSDEEENDNCHTDDDEDIFVDGMEEINSPRQTEIPKINIPLMKPSSSAPVPTLQTLPQHDVPSTEEKKAASIQEPVDTASFVDTVPIERTKELNIPSLSQEADQLPETDPAALLKAYPQFIEYLQLSSSPIVQTPSRENGHVTVRRFDIAHHPMGGFLSESVWKNCSIWDIKAVIESPGARRIWDNTFESTTLLHALTPTSSLWHTKVKGAWPIQPRDYVCFHGQYTSSGVPRIDLLSTSCLGDSFQYKPLPPKQIPGYTRAIMDIMGWRLERVDETTALVRQVLVTQFPSWVIQYITSRFSVQTCSAVQFAQDYLEKHGAPPSLESLSYALLVDIKHDHERKNWRCEYTRRTDKNESDVGPLNTPSTVSVIRLDKRRWATRNAYAVVIDPPPSSISATEKSCDPYGVWLTVEHDEAFIIPLRGKILVLIKPEESPSNHKEGCLLNVNGIATPIQREETKLISTPKPKEEKTAVEPELTEEEQVSAALDKVSPKDHAQAALLFLKQTDEQFGWTVLSDKSGMRISKKPGIKNTQLPMKDNHEIPSKLQVFDPYMVYKGTKVIENFSADEVLAVVKDTDYVRTQYDDTIESPIELVRQTNYPACKVIRYAVKAMFPFKNREVYAVSCLAHETVSCKRTFYIESSLPDFPLINPKKTRGHLFMSGWILEEIDPYNTTTANHPIPSTRVTYVAALDLGNSVPSYISNLVANNWFPKKIQAVESYLKSKGSPPFITQPNPALVFSGNTLDKDKEGVEWKTIHSSFDEKHQFEIKTRLEINEHTSTSNKKKQQQQKTEEGTASPYRRPSHHTISVSTDTQGRRGSLPTAVLAKKRVVMTPSSSTATSTTTPLTEKSSSTTKSYTFLHTTFDLRAYTKGYEIEAQLYDVTDSSYIKNISNKLVLSISEPSLSQLMDGKKKSTKHTITVKTQQGTSLFKSLPALFEFEFKLMPIRQEAAASTTKLTVSHVLGEDEDDGKEKWRGTIMVNGIEAHSNTEISLKSLLANEEKTIHSNTSNETIPQDNQNDIVDAESNSMIENETTLSLDDNTSKVQIESESSSQYIGGSVVATALENVSAGVNTIGARMMIPFRAASNSFLLSNMNEQGSLDDQQTSSDDEEQEKGGGIRIRSFTREERHKIKSATTLHEVRLLRKSSDTMRKGMLLLSICLGLAIVFALLLLQPMLERYYASFGVSSTIASLDHSIEQGIVRRLLQIPWFGGWDIQVIAVQRQN